MDSSASEQVFGSDPFSGPAVVVYNVPALAAGTYFFRCDVHPDMAGRRGLTVDLEEWEVGDGHDRPRR